MADFWCLCAGCIEYNLDCRLAVADGNSPEMVDDHVLGRCSSGIVLAYKGLAAAASVPKL